MMQVERAFAQMFLAFSVGYAPRTRGIAQLPDWLQMLLLTANMRVFAGRQELM
jgi:hypothetical protein